MMKFNLHRISLKSVFLAFLALLFTVTSSVQPVAAFEESFYGSNGILYYDDRDVLCNTSAGSNSNVSLSGKDSLEKIYNFLSQNSQIKNNTQFSEEYIVNPGDSLWKISKSRLNNEFLWKKIAQLNNLENPSLIYPYQKLIIPVDVPDNFIESNVDSSSVISPLISSCAVISGVH